MTHDKTKLLVLHTGDHKTGSTSIQYALAEGRVSLTDRTLSYPTRIAHNYLAERFKKPRDAVAKARLSALAKTIAQTSADVTIVSAEDLEGVNPDKVKYVWDTYLAQAAEQIRIVSYVRPHASRTVSSCAEQLKIGVFSGASLDEFFALRNMEKRLSYAPRCRSWRATFGDAYALRPFLRDELHDGSAVADFLKTAVGDTGFEIQTGQSANESLSLRDLMILKLVHQNFADLPAHDRLGLGWGIARHLNAHGASTGEKLALHRSLAKEMATVFHKDAKAMDMIFFDGRPLMQDALDRSVETAIATPQSLRIEDHLNAAERRDITAMAMTMRDMFSNAKGWAGYFREQKIKALTLV